MSSLGDFVVKTPLQNYKNNIAKTYYNGGKKGRKPKETKSKNGQHEGTIAKVVNSAGGMNSVNEMKFHNAPFSSLFALLSFWDLICNDEFNSGSSCLN